ncbi:glycine zipper 2TM domain-containing protein [Acidovorax sp.]|uniref:glycine zipper 2TM domain-containing protein n=1 Tax=Acidovorax sp. TaxID=1872122 RepID=UPI002ACD7DC2|nr:glycine zipper 2TM domain-containing protein [Acidovorax sp.]MDZ7864844.1 glycine zipper 2TM domain-containing protein [Acidovorax sp.]
MNNPVTLQPSDVRTVPSTPSPMKWMWVAIASLGACVVALGTTLVVQHRPTEVPAAATAASPVVVAPSLQGVPAQPPLGLVQAQAGAPVQRAPAPMPEPFHPQRANLAGGTAQMVQRAPVCNTCGRVESVQAIQQAEPATGVGAVAGGVLGAVVGNQIGKGSGRTAATVLGAVGGGYVGHQVEQRSRTRTVYQVAIRMDDGSLRRFTRAQPPAVGTPVALQGKGYRIDHERDSRPNGGGAYTNNAPAGAVRVANGY